MSNAKPISSCQVSSTTPSVHKLQQQQRVATNEKVTMAKHSASFKSGGSSSFKSPSSYKSSFSSSSSSASSSGFKSSSPWSSSSSSSTSSSFKSSSSSSTTTKCTCPPPRRVTYVTDFPTRYEKPLPSSVIDQAVRDLERKLICKPGKAKR